jgi:hypothetical protein
MTETRKILTMNGEPKQYHCKDCGRVLALVCGRVIGFPLIFGYTPLIELKNEKDFFPLVCVCETLNKIRGEK